MLLVCCMCDLNDREIRMLILDLHNLLDLRIGDVFRTILSNLLNTWILFVRRKHHRNQNNQFPIGLALQRMHHQELFLPSSDVLRLFPATKFHQHLGMRFRLIRKFRVLLIIFLIFQRLLLQSWCMEEQELRNLLRQYRRIFLLLLGIGSMDLLLELLRL